MSNVSERCLEVVILSAYFLGQKCNSLFGAALFGGEGQRAASRPRWPKERRRLRQGQRLRSMGHDPRLSVRGRPHHAGGGAAPVRRFAVHQLAACRVSNGSIPVAELHGRHGRTCFNTGRQVTHPLCRFLIDEMPVSTNGNRRARSTPESRRHGRRPWHLQRARSRLPRCKKQRRRFRY